MNVESLMIWDGNEGSPRIEIYTEPGKIIAKFVSPGSPVLSKVVLESGQAPRLEYRLQGDTEPSIICINETLELHVNNKSDSHL